MDNLKLNSPIVIGGIGGSGMRVLVLIFEKLNIYMGRGHLDETLDDTYYTFIFKRQIKLSSEQFKQYLQIYLSLHLGAFESTKKNISLINKIYKMKTPQVNSCDKHKIYEQIKAGGTQIISPGTVKWGWKEPNSYVYLDKLIKYLPNIKYIHVMRNGLDMVFNCNQNQVMFWENHSREKLTPSIILNYWVNTQKRMKNLRKKYPKNILIISYEEFCERPEEFLRKIFKFIEVGEVSAEKIKYYATFVTPVPGINIYKNYPSSIFTDKQKNIVRSYGYKIKYN